MQPTAAARQMYRLFLPILRDYTHAREQVLRTDGELNGHVNVGMIASVAQGVLSGGPGGIQCPPSEGDGNRDGRL